MNQMSYPQETSSLKQVITSRKFHYNMHRMPRTQSEGALSPRWEFRQGFLEKLRCELKIPRGQGHN